MLIQNLTYYVTPYVYMFGYIVIVGPLIEIMIKALYDNGFFELSSVKRVLDALGVRADEHIVPGMFLPCGKF